jgi:serine/threonine protein kinase
VRPTSGITLGGRFQLTTRIAIGGMGEVWKAKDQILGRIVAIKVLKEEYTGDPASSSGSAPKPATRRSSTTWASPTSSTTARRKAPPTS